MERICLHTKRLFIRPRTAEELEELQSHEPDAEMKKAYGEMLSEMRAHPENSEWGTDWLIALPNGTCVGGAGFKGKPDQNGSVEIGYGIHAKFRKHGYATEAVQELCRWALNQPDVRCVTAETLPENAISQRILKVCGFRPTGTAGEEGPRFILSTKNTGPLVSSLSEQDARTIAAWRYPSPYDIYNCPAWEMMAAQNWGLTNSQSRKTEFYSLYDGVHLIGYFRLVRKHDCIMLGLGLHPDLCGHGCGKILLALSISAARKAYPNEKKLCLEVRTFNLRAQKCYEQAGFRTTDRYFRQTPTGRNEFLLMEHSL